MPWSYCEYDNIDDIENEDANVRVCHGATVASGGELTQTAELEPTSQTTPLSGRLQNLSGKNTLKPFKLKVL